MASALHDIGKINIPTILNKPGKLTPEEFEIMKTHTTIGDKILHELPFGQDAPLVKTARQICHWHHERYDGRGYPSGLKATHLHRCPGRSADRRLRRPDRLDAATKSL